MNFLTIVDNLGIGGTQRAAQNYAIAYQRAGCDSALLSLGGDGPRRQPLEQAGVRCIFASSTEFGSSTEALAIRPNLDEALRYKPDAIHLHRAGYADPLAEAILAYLLNALPYRPVVLETNVFSRPDYSAGRHLIDVHLHLSNWGLAKWRAWTRGQRPRPVGLVVPYLVDASSFRRATDQEAAGWRQQFDIFGHEFLLLRVGQPIGGKWSIHAFAAFEEYLRRGGQGCFAVVGLPPTLKSEVERLRSDRGAKIIEIEPRHDDAFLSCAYAACDVFLHTADIGESFGMVLAEAALAERPIVTLSTPLKDNGQTEVVRHRETGLVCNDVSGLAEALALTAKSPALRQELGRRGRTHVLLHYSSESLVPQLLDIVATARRHDDPKLRRQALRDKGYDRCPSLNTLAGSSSSYLGSPPRGDAIWRSMLHLPFIYRAYLATRNRAWAGWPWDIGTAEASLAA